MDDNFVTAPSNPACDEAAILERLNDDRDLLAEIVGLLEAQAPAAVEEIRRAIMAGDAPGLERTAHKLRGSLLSVGATTSADLTHTLETIGRGGTALGAEAHLPALETEIHRLIDALRRLTRVAPR